MLRQLTSIFLLLSSLPGQGQDLTGTWVGYSDMDYIKLVIVHKGDSLLGYTYDEGPGWCKASFTGRYNNKIKYLKGSGMEIMNQSGSHGLAVYSLEYAKKNGVEMLNGLVRSKRTLLNLFSLSGPSPIYLNKLNNEIDTLDFLRPFIAEKAHRSLQERDGPKAPAGKKVDSVQSQLPEKPIATNFVETEKKARISKVMQRISTNADSIKIGIYDNGEVDQDSVSIFFDDALILNRYMISDKPIELTIALPKDGKEHSLELFAHNLGTIPPNTALVIITAGKKRYELRASYDLHSNARIVFSYDSKSE